VSSSGQLPGGADERKAPGWGTCGGCRLREPKGQIRLSRQSIGSQVPKPTQRSERQGALARFSRAADTVKDGPDPEQPLKNQSKIKLNSCKLI